MVFTKLSPQEKDAFFGLLDEYFRSRPELFGQNDSDQGVSALAGTGISTAVATSVVQRAFAPNATGSSGGGASGRSNNPYATPNVDVTQAATAVGRVAAASLAFSQAQAGAGGSSSSPSLLSSLKPADGPPSLPRRVSSNAPAPGSAEQGLPGSEVDKLITRKTSVFATWKKQPVAGVAVPPAFDTPKNNYGPPPVRRATSETSAGTSVGTGVGTRVAQLRQVPHPPEEEEAGAEAGGGEWAEVLYDYSSEDPGDLAIEAGTKVLVTAKSSDDWWTGQVEGRGREGLFPAAYVKLL